MRKLLSSLLLLSTFAFAAPPQPVGLPVYHAHAEALRAMFFDTHTRGGSGGSSYACCTDTGTAFQSTEPFATSIAASSTVAAYQFGATNRGVFNGSANTVGIGNDTSTSWAQVSNAAPAGLSVGSGECLGWSSSASFSAAAPDTCITRISAGIPQVGLVPSASPAARTFQVGESSRGGTDTDAAGAAGTVRPGTGTGAGASSTLTIAVPAVLTTGTTAQSYSNLEQWSGGASADPSIRTATVLGTHGEQWIRGQNTELLTLSTGGTTTDTTNNLLPANSIIEAVVCRINTTITTATNWSVGDATIAARFAASNSTLTSGTTSVGLQAVDQTGTSGPKQTAAAKVRITTTGTPGAGAIRITVFYRQFVAPTS